MKIFQFDAGTFKLYINHNYYYFIKKKGTYLFLEHHVETGLMADEVSLSKIYIKNKFNIR